MRKINFDFVLAISRTFTFNRTFRENDDILVAKAVPASEQMNEISFINRLEKRKTIVLYAQNS